MREVLQEAEDGLARDASAVQVNFPEVSLQRSCPSTDFLNASVSDVFGETDIQTGEMRAVGADNGQHGVVTDGVELQSEYIAKSGQDVL